MADLPLQRSSQVETRSTSGEISRAAAIEAAARIRQAEAARLRNIDAAQSEIMSAQEDAERIRQSQIAAAERSVEELGRRSTVARELLDRSRRASELAHERLQSTRQNPMSGWDNTSRTLMILESALAGGNSVAAGRVASASGVIDRMMQLDRDQRQARLERNLRAAGVADDKLAAARAQLSGIEQRQSANVAAAIKARLDSVAASEASAEKRLALYKLGADVMDSATSRLVDVSKAATGKSERSTIEKAETAKPETANRLTGKQRTELASKYANLGESIDETLNFMLRAAMTDTSSELAGVIGRSFGVKTEANILTDAQRRAGMTLAKSLITGSLSDQEGESFASAFTSGGLKTKAAAEFSLGTGLAMLDRSVRNAESEAVASGDADLIQKAGAVRAKWSRDLPAFVGRLQSAGIRPVSAKSWRTYQAR